jgi:hypothetical protein
MDSKADKPCRFPVLTIERTAANRSRPQLERNPLVTFRKITLEGDALPSPLESRLRHEMGESHANTLGHFETPIPTGFCH